MNLDDIAGIAHRPARDTAAGAVVLTHGAGGSRDSPLLIRICDEWAAHGWLAIRYNLPYRRRRPTGPPSGPAADLAGIGEALGFARTLTDGPLVAGGHSYGGRLTSMAAADGATVDMLTLFSYPLHPPGKPDRPRTAHFPAIRVPTVFAHCSADPFGGIDELRAAVGLIPSPTQIVEVSGARHDLGSKVNNVAALAVSAALELGGFTALR